MTGDGNLLAGWERSAGLHAPPAPADGVLAPNGAGYLLAVGPPAQRLYPRAASAARWASVLALPVVLAMPFVLVPAPYGALGVAALGALACWLPGAVLGAFARGRLASRLEAGEGRLSRLAGTVADQATVPSLFAGRPAVLATSDCLGVVETRGIDFDVRLGDGTLVRVPARDAVLLGRGSRVRGQPSCGPVTLAVSGGGARLRSALLSADGWVSRLLGLAMRELTLGPGDPVEICGALDFEPDESGRGGFRRGPALRAVLRPVDGMPVVVRKLAPGTAARPDSGAAVSELEPARRQGDGRALPAAGRLAELVAGAAPHRGAGAEGHDEADPGDDRPADDDR